VVWAIVAPPLLVYGATRIRRGQVRMHASVMALAVVLEILVFISFGFLMEPGSRRPDLEALPIFKIHLLLAVSTFVGIAWQLVSRAVPAWRRFHSSTGPYVILVWVLALITGIYNFVFLYLLI